MASVPSTSHSLPFKPESLYYDGKPQVPKSKEPIPVIEPSTGLPFQETVYPSDETEINEAVKSAQQAFQTWSTTPAIARSRILLRAVQILRDRNDELAEVETRNTGKPFSETSTVDIATGADVLEFYANLVGGGGLNGETIQLREDAWAYTRKEPLGVCAGIGAWNYPIQIALWKSAPCLAAGNTMVYKPSEFTPFHGAELAAIYTAAGLPPGVFNVVNGDGKVGQALSVHPDIAKVSFTGQVSTGQKVAGNAAGQMKYVTMELGGKSPLIICPDASLDAAVDAAMMANFYSSGQICTNGTRVFVPEALLEAFEKRLLEKMEYIRAGDLMDPKTNFGPLSSAVHHAKVLNYIKHGIETDKATLLCGGTAKPSFVRTGGSSSSIAAEGGGLDAQTHGFWVQPTVFTRCNDSMKIVQDEIFGPVMCILSYTDVEEAVRRANATQLGLAAGVVTGSVDLAHRITARLQAGITWINTWGESPAEMAVGGFKKSGLGVENGRQGLAAWTQNKSTLVDMSGKIASVFEAE